MRKATTYIDKTTYELLKKYKPNDSLSSIRVHLLNLHKLERLIRYSKLTEEEKKDPDFLIRNKDIEEKIFDDFEHVKRLIANDENTNHTKRNRFTSIVVYLKAMGSKNPELLKNYSECMELFSHRVEKQKFKKNPKEEKEWMTREEIDKVLETMIEKMPENIERYNELFKYMKYIALYFHVNIECLRNELADTQLMFYNMYDRIKHYEELNYIILTNTKDKHAVCYLNNYKTKKKYNQIDIDLTSEHNEELKKYLIELKKYKDAHNITNNWMFINRDGTKMTRNMYSWLIKNCFEGIGKKVGVNMLRKILASENCPIKEIKEKARRMGHSVETHLNHYVKET
jgi:hypothetical protein